MKKVPSHSKSETIPIAEINNEIVGGRASQRSAPIAIAGPNEDAALVFFGAGGQPGIL